MRRLRTRLPAVIGVLVIAFAAAACSPDEPTDYTAENSDGFFAACLQSPEDSFLQAKLCQCVFDNAVLEIPFDRFVEIDESLTLDPLAPLPEELTEIMAQCVIEEADL